MSTVGLEIIVQPEVERLGDGPFARSVEHLTAPLCRCGRVTYEIDWLDKGPVHGMQEKWVSMRGYVWEEPFQVCSGEQISFRARFSPRPNQHRRRMVGVTEFTANVTKDDLLPLLAAGPADLRLKAFAALRMIEDKESE